ncbi:hypothetical protein ABT026_30595 [Streptomyces sp. NPDC002734]|uniref:hypothetical protein n=1 Tax=Streptomyces sp. NPDC002734 TaxID=3154426 RepID=UPI0033169B82
MPILPERNGKKRPDAEPEVPQVSPAELAQQAVARLKLPVPVIRMNPDEDFAQVVHVPTWMWMPEASWGPVTETVSVPGVSVTATARPRRAVWSMGDGTTVTCDGPGTPYSSRFRADAESPDCGHVYRRASLAEPGGKYRVTVTVLWDVEWSGGGQSGTGHGLSSTTERHVLVDEVQAVVAR